MSNIFNTTGEIETLDQLFIMSILKASKITSVASICKVDSIEKEYSDELGYGIVNIIPIPIEPEQNNSIKLQAYYFSPGEFNNKYYLVIYTDYDFRDNLNSYEIKKTSNKNMHNKNFAVLIRI